MAWPDLPASIDLLATNYHNAYYQRSDAQTQINFAWDDWNVGDDHACLVNVLQAIQKHNDALDSMIAFALPLTPDTLLPAILYQLRYEYSTQEYELTMSKILAAMITADLDEYRRFIGIADAYRVALWNKPFNAEFYAALARGFME